MRASKWTVWAWFLAALLLFGTREGAAQTTWYVDEDAAGVNDGSSWTDAFVNLQSALAEASSEDDIWVAEGTYKPAGPGGDREATFQLIGSVAVYGGFPDGGGLWASRNPAVHPTTLSGDLNGDDGPDFANNDENSCHVVTVFDPAAVLDGLTIMAGNADLLDHFHYYGGGIFQNRGSLTLTNCRFLSNWSDYGGGGMYGRGDLKVTNCLFIGNTAGGGGAIAVTLLGSKTITNCTIVGNSAFGGGGGINNVGGSPTITNCILWANSDSGGMDESAQVFDLSGGPPSVVNYSCVQGGWTGAGGTGNISSDPLFVSFATAPSTYRLSAGSPCIDAGSNMAFLNEAVSLGGLGGDLDRKGRFVDNPGPADTGTGAGAVVDMGEYEFRTGQADLDGDGDVDGNDFLTFSVCYNGSMNRPLCP